MPFSFLCPILKRLALLTVICVPAQPVAALDLWPGASLTGTVRLSHFDFGFDTDRFLETDLDLVWQAPPSDGLRFGAAIGVRSLNGFVDAKDNASYRGGLLVSFGQTTLMLGAPWSPLEKLGGPKRFTLGSFGPITQADYLDFALLSNRATGYGVGLYHEADRLSFGLSLRRFNGDFNDGNDAMATLRYQMGQTLVQVVLGALQRDGSATERLASLDVTQELGRLELTGSILDLNRPGLDDFRALRLQAAYQLTDTFAVDAGVMDISGSLDATLYTVNAELNLANGLFLQGGIQKAEGRQSTWKIDTGFRF